jgi:hypothetical protein
MASESTPTDSVEYWADLLKKFRMTVSHACEDSEAASESTPPIYHLDFSLLAPILFTAPGSLSKPAMPGTIDAVRYLTQSGYTPDSYRLTISGTTYYEFLDRLNHQMDAIERVPRLATDVIKRLVDGDLLTRSARLSHDLSLLTEDGGEAQTTKPAKRLLEMLNLKVLRGLGDYVQPLDRINSDRVKLTFDRIYAEQRNARLRKDVARRRKPEGAEFHYKMDAASICLSLFCTGKDHSKAVFVTDSLFHLRYAESNDDLFARHFYTPLQLKNISLLKGGGYFRDSISYLLDAFSECDNLLEELRFFSPDHPISDLPLYMIKRLIYLRATYLDPLLATGHELIPASGTEFNDNIRALLSNSATIQSSVRDAEDRIRDAARQLKSYEHNFGDDLLDQFGLHEDPIMKRIKDRFGI